MRYLIYIISISLLCCNDMSKRKQAEVLKGIEIGIESIEFNDDKTLDIAIYMYNTIEVAGFQADLMPKGSFTIESVSGWIGEELGFMMSGGKNTFLGFSIKGDLIPVSKTSYLSDNIICHIKAKSNTKLTFPMEVSLNPIIAGQRGVKLESNTRSYIWEK